MSEVTTIVAALDLEAGSGAVLGRAAQLTAQHQARLVVVHVIEAQPPSRASALSDCSDLDDRLISQAHDAVSALLAEEGCLSADVEIGLGSAHTVVSRVAGEHSADLVVIGPGKYHWLGDKVLGSTADRVVRASPAPVLVVKQRPAGPYRHVAAAVDFSPQSAAAVQDARRLAPGAHIDLVHIFSVPLAFEQAMLRAGTSRADMDAYRSAKARKAREELSLFAREGAGAGRFETRLIEGEPGPVLVHLAKTGDIDLLALGPNGRGVVLQTLLGSVTQRVLREAGCDVLVARIAG